MRVLCDASLFEERRGRPLPFRVNSMSNYRQKCMFGSIVAFKFGYMHFGETYERKKKEKKKKKNRKEEKRVLVCCTSTSKVR